MLKLPGIIILSAFVFIIVTGCCRKVGCEDVAEINQMLFINFTADEIDTLCVQSYNRGTHFVTDSFVITEIYTRESYSHHVSFKRALAANFDWLITLKSTGEQYRFSDLEYRKEVCGSCFFSKSYVNNLYYTVNGNPQSGTLMVAK